MPDNANKTARPPSMTRVTDASQLRVTDEILAVGRSGYDEPHAYADVLVVVEILGEGRVRCAPKYDGCMVPRGEFVEVCPEDPAYPFDWGYNHEGEVYLFERCDFIGEERDEGDPDWVETSIEEKLKTRLEPY